MSAQFARILSPVPAVPAGHGGGEAPSAETGGLLAQAAAGPGLWEDLLGELRRAGLIAELLADGVITAAVAQAEHGHKLDRLLTAQVTAMCVIVGALFPDQGYDLVLARTFKMPGLPVKPGTVTPSGPALSRARALLGEQVMRRIFELDAARTDLDLGIGATWHGMETTGMDGTTIELFNNDELADTLGVPSGGTKPKIRIAAHVRTGSRRWIAAAIGGYCDGENTLADELESSFTPGILNLADRGFFSMDRWIRFSASGVHLAWRVKNGAKSVPFKTLKTLTDGSELVLLRESDSMLGKRRRDAGDKTLPRLPDTIARLVSFTVTARTARRARTTTIKVLTTLLDPGAFPAREIAALYAEKIAGRNRLLPPEENHQGHRPRAARTLRHPGPAGNLGAAADPQHDRYPRRPRRRAGRPGPGPDPVHRRAVTDTRPRRRRYLLPALRQAPRQRKRTRRPARQPDPRSASPPGPARPDLRQDSVPAAALAHRRGHIHDNDRPVESPASGVLTELTMPG